MIFYRTISFGSACNNRCVGCEAEGDMTSPSLDGLIRQVDGLDNLENVAFLGGEPTLFSDLISLVSQIRARGAKRIKLVSNGRRLGDMDFLAGLVDAGCRVFEVKIEGSRPEVHEAVTGTRDSFGETLQGLENLGSLGRSAEYGDTLLVAARVGVTETNLGDLVPIVSLLTSFGVDRIVLACRSCDFSMADGAVMVTTAIKVATLNRTWAQSEGFPPCLMGGCERHVSELLDPRPRSGEKPKGCLKCDYEGFCGGPPARYLQERGPKEFRTVSGSSYLEDIRRLFAMRFAHGQP